MREAALEPKLFREIKDRFEDIPVPPIQGVITYLNREGFNPSAVNPAAKAFVTTMEFIESLGDSESHSLVQGNDAESSSMNDEDTFEGVSVGDLIQWESQGAQQFETPRRVRWVSDDGTLLAVEGSNTGIPMSQVTLEHERPRVSSPPIIPPEERSKSSQPIEAAGQRKAVFPLSEGDVTFLFPEKMTQDGIEELEAYLKVFLKKEKREASKD